MNLHSFGLNRHSFWMQTQPLRCQKDASTADFRGHLRAAAGAMLLLAGACDTPAPAVPVGPPNILLVSLDTTRADHTSPYGAPAGNTPVLSHIASQGTLFQRAFSQSNESAYSHGSLFTGRYASELAEPVYQTYGIPGDATFVSEALQAYGYRTAMFSAGGHVTADYGFAQGWDRYVAAPGFGSIWETGASALDWIDSDDNRPYFVFLHGYDAHRPYSREGFWDHLLATGEGSDLAENLARSPCLSEMVRGRTLYPALVPDWFRHESGAQIMDPASYDRLANPPPDTTTVPISDDDVKHIQDHYDGSLRYADTLLGLVLSRLEDAGRLENTIVIITADHGEDLLDHGFMNHRTGLWDSCTHVPLIVTGPGFPAGASVDSLVDARDVAATVLAVAGARPPAGSGGRDLRSVLAGNDLIDAVFMEGVMDMVSVRTNTHRLVYRGAPLHSADYVERLANTPPTDDGFVLYDLRSDPREQVDVHIDQAETTAMLRDRLVAWRRGLTVGAYTHPQDLVSPEVARSLREHGYWDAGGPPSDEKARYTDTVGKAEVTPPKGPMDDPGRFCSARLKYLPENQP